MFAKYGDSIAEIRIEIMNTKPILLRLPSPLVDRLDEAREALHFSRTELILRSIQRDLDYMVEYEVEKARRFREGLDASYSKWAQSLTEAAQ